MTTNHKNTDHKDENKTKDHKDRDSGNLSNAARTMKTASSHEERGKAAAQMGKVGGEHSHGSGHKKDDKDYQDYDKDGHKNNGKHSKDEENRKDNKKSHKDEDDDY